MGQKRIAIKIDNKGNYTLQTVDGFAGQSCVAVTENLALAIGGSLKSEGKTDDYYRPENEAPVNLTY